MITTAQDVTVADLTTGTRIKYLGDASNQPANGAVKCADADDVCITFDDGEEAWVTIGAFSNDGSAKWRIDNMATPLWAAYEVAIMRLAFDYDTRLRRVTAKPREIIMTKSKYDMTIRIASDSVARLRSCDVYRCLEAAEEGGFLELFAKRLESERQDLAGEINECAVEIDDRR